MVSILASFESFLGSIWFAGLLGLVGYVVGHVFPITKLGKLFSKE